MKKVVTIFGSSIPLKGEKQYEDAYKLGCLLAQKNFDVCTGGNLGIMEAVSKGAIENGARAIGITLKGKFDNHNKFLSEQICCDSLFERINNLINSADAFVILPGGTGTLLELSAVWEFLNKNFIDEKPVACLGEMWKDIIKIMDEQLQKENRKTGLVKHFENIDDCVNFISNSCK